MSNIITRGYKGIFKVITQGFFGVSGGEFVKICSIRTERFICQKTTTVKNICQSLDNEHNICQTLSSEG